MRESTLNLFRLAAPAIVVVAALAAANLGRSGNHGALRSDQARAEAPIMAEAISSARAPTCVPGGETAVDLATWGALDDLAIPTPCPSAATEFPRKPAPSVFTNMLG